MFSSDGNGFIISVAYSHIPDYEDVLRYIFHIDKQAQC